MQPDGYDSDLFSVQGTVDWPSDKSVRDDTLIDIIREGAGLNGTTSAMIGSLVCKNVPFDHPTLCRVSATTAKGGSGNTAEGLQHIAREFVISEEFSLFDAFTELLGECKHAVAYKHAWSAIEPK